MDDEWIMFQATPREAQCDQQFTMRPDGSDLSLVSTGVGRTTCGYFFPGNDKIVYGSTHLGGDECPPEADMSQGYVWALYEDYDVFVADADGSNLVQITDTPAYDAEATVSRDGEWVVFTSARDGDLEIYKMRMDGSEVTRLTDSPGYDGGPFFSYDGTKIVYRASHPEGDELAWMSRLGKETGRPVSFACLQNPVDPDQWKRLLEAVDKDRAEGGCLTPQVAQRPAGLLLGWESSFHPFALSPAYRPYAELAPRERVAKLRDPAVRAEIVASPPELAGGEDRVVERLRAQQTDVEQERLGHLAGLAVPHHRRRRRLAAHPDEGEALEATFSGLGECERVGAVGVPGSCRGEDLLLRFDDDRLGFPCVVVLDAGHQRGVDVVVDNVGTTFPLSFRAARKGGRILTVGNTGSPKIEIDNRYIFSKHLSLIGSTMGTWHDFATVMDLIYSGRLHPVLDRSYPLSEARLAQERLEKGQQMGKITLEIGF